MNENNNNRMNESNNNRGGENKVKGPAASKSSLATPAMRNPIANPYSNIYNSDIYNNMYDKSIQNDKKNGQNDKKDAKTKEEDVGGKEEMKEEEKKKEESREGFMKGVTFSILGYDKSVDASGIAENCINIGKGIYNKQLDKNLDITAGPQSDLIIVEPGTVYTLPADYPYLVDWKLLFPNLKFIRGLRYLERCCSAGALLKPDHTEVLYEDGGIVLMAPDVFDEPDIMQSIINLLSDEKVFILFICIIL